MYHPKFSILSASAMCLWDEVKNFCDKWHTNGLLPKHEMKLRRFYAPKYLAELVQSAGKKPDGTAYAPLVEATEGGYQMHDYLDYNQTREQALLGEADAKDRAELRQAGNRKRQAESRARRKVELEALRNAESNAGTPLRTQIASGPIAVAVVPEVPQKMKEPSSEGGAPPAPAPRPGAPIHDRSHIKHAVCGRVCLHAGLFNEFVRRRNHDHADQEIRAWAAEVIDAWTTGAFHAIEPGDPFEFWKLRYAEQWPAALTAKLSKLPAWAQK